MADIAATDPAKDVVDGAATFPVKIRQFLQNGGIFIPGNRPCQLGEEVFLLLSLMQDEARYPVAGKVAWITPSGAANNHTQGIGLQFPADDAGRRVRQRIEEILGTALGSSRPTHTM